LCLKPSFFEARGEVIRIVWLRRDRRTCDQITPTCSPDLAAVIEEIVARVQLGDHIPVGASFHYHFRFTKARPCHPFSIFACFPREGRFHSQRPHFCGWIALQGNRLLFLIVWVSMTCPVSFLTGSQL
jgi:hypothetical protein